ncbi:MAG TPA: hypothetical protein VGO47_03915 [Chlamydiales bacterium]|jgi:lysophospholipase|nr:hypothetical protein [Chlamydiales bacterium]
MSSDGNPWAGSYAAKSNQPCPSTPLLRVFSSSTQSLSDGETSYISGRQKLLPKAWQDWLGDASQIGYNLTEFIEADAMPRVGIACSGGGFRASLFCAGILNAFDGRNDTAKEKGTGGLFQVSTYMAGVSGAVITSKSKKK